MNELATIRATTQRLNQMIEEGSGGYHDDLLIRVTDGRVETLMQTNGRQVVSYCTWEEGYFDEVSGEAEAIMPVGGSNTDSKGFLDYMEFAGRADGTVELTLLGDGEDGQTAPLASHWEAEGSLNARVRLPTSADDLDEIPFDHPPRWTPDDEYASQRCLDDDGTLPDDPDEWVTPPLTIETSASVVRSQIIEPADFADGVNYRPITVEDGEFTVKVEGSQHDDSIWGAVNAERVEGPDVNRQFRPGFDEVFGTIDGPVTLQTAPSGDGPIDAPLTIVQDGRSDRTIRHLVSALAAT